MVKDSLLKLILHLLGFFMLFSDMVPTDFSLEHWFKLLIKFLLSKLSLIFFAIVLIIIAKFRLQSGYQRFDGIWIVHVFSLCIHLWFKGKKFNRKLSEALLFLIGLILASLNKECKVASVQRVLVQGIRNVSEILVKLLDWPQVGVLHGLWGTSEEIGMGIFEELFKLSLACCSCLKGATHWQMAIGVLMH